jgi:hypothetical protein
MAARESPTMHKQGMKRIAMKDHKKYTAKKTV